MEVSCLDGQLFFSAGLEPAVRTMRTGQPRYVIEHVLLPTGIITAKGVLGAYVGSLRKRPSTLKLKPVSTSCQSPTYLVSVPNESALQLQYVCFCGRGLCASAQTSSTYDHYDPILMERGCWWKWARSLSTSHTEFGWREAKHLVGVFLTDRLFLIPRRRATANRRWMAPSTVLLDGWKTTPGCLQPSTDPVQN